jgi:hypothetical protein
MDTELSLNPNYVDDMEQEISNIDYLFARHFANTKIEIQTELLRDTQK